MSADLGLESLPLATEYRTGEADPVGAFYRPCLGKAVEYKRAVGFFRSSVYLIIGGAVIGFANRGGRIKLVCSPALTFEDVERIELGYKTREEGLNALLTQEIERLLASEATEYRVRVLGTLVAVGALDIRLAVRPDSFGLYHEKLGVFRDVQDRRVSFLGSANETWNGWHERGNHEAIEVFCSWRGNDEAERVKRHDSYFDRLWDGLVPGIEIAEFPEAAKARLSALSLRTLDGVDIDTKDPIGKRRSALPHQQTAIDAWRAAGRRGILEHATGSGKTFTALLVIKEHVDQGLPALVLVPGELLLHQWANEIQDEIPGAVILLVGAGNDRWRQPGRLAGFTDPDSALGSRVVLATMQTAATDTFLSQLRSGTHLMVVADEVHQIGSPHNSKSLAIDSGPRLGLSATPNRYGDPDGTARLVDYFGPVIAPSVTLQDAIRAGRLVEYEYHPLPVRLTADEARQWRDLTQTISLEIARQKEDASGRKPLSERARMLLIQRARIAKKASQKPSLAASVLRETYREGERWLVYCEDSEQLHAVMNDLLNVGLHPVEYHTAAPGDLGATLSWFRSFGGVLVSIRCLDEGVDIPQISHAMILASSQNPRQFIQRRGRVLRKAPGKHIAVIYDAIVVPVNLNDEPEQLSLLKSEFLRAIQFSRSAINRDAGAELRAIAIAMGLDPDGCSEIGIEEDD